MVNNPSFRSFTSVIPLMGAALLMFVVTISASGPAHAGLLVQQQPALFEDSVEPMVSDSGQSITRGDTFTIPGDGSSVPIGSVEWWGWYTVGTRDHIDFLDDFTLEIYEFENGVPKTDPLHSFPIGDVIENAVFTRAGVIRGSSRDDRWAVAHDLGTDIGGGMMLQRYEALFTENPIELESGRQYLLSIVNNNADGGLYFFEDGKPYPEYPPLWAGIVGLENLAWNWARVDNEVGDPSSSWERSGETAWREIFDEDDPEADDPDAGVYNPDLAFSLYDCAGNVDPIVYLHFDGVYRISNLPIGDTEYNLKFVHGHGASMKAHTEFKSYEDAAAASDAINTVLNAQLPDPPVDTVSTNLSFPKSESIYVVPIMESEKGSVVVMQGIGPEEGFENDPSWFRGESAFVDATDKAMYTVFIKLGEVVPEPTFSPVFLDIKPGSCPNPLNLKNKGVLPVAILGTEDFDVTTIDPATIRLSKEGVAGRVSPLRWSYEDVATPIPSDWELCDCWDYNGDGYTDLTLKFKAQEVIYWLELDENVGETIPLTLKAHLRGCGAIQGQDCVRIKYKKPKK